MTSKQKTVRFGVVLAALAASAGVVAEFTIASDARAGVTDRPIEVDADGYVGSQECRSCHPTEYASWHRSYHRTMTQQVTPETVKANFDDVELELDGAQYHLSREGDHFYAEMETLVPGQSSKRERKRHELVLVTGSHHMQVFWYPTGADRKLGQLPFTYLIDDGGWVPRRATFVRPPDRPRHSDEGRWGYSCLNCHATHGRPRIDEEGHMDTQVTEFGISCEACHGPGGNHVRANMSPLRRYRAYLSDSGDDTITQPRKIGHELGSEVCGHCHGIYEFQGYDEQVAWTKRGFAYRPGGTHKEQYLFQPSWAGQQPKIAKIVEEHPEYARGQFWSDGVSRTSGREYNGMIDSDCFSEGEIACASCHRMHRDSEDPRSLDDWANYQLERDMHTDKACLNCHESYAGDLEAHTHHAPETEGSRCYNCHMPYTSYGLLRAMRSHYIGSPDTADEIATGRPNACNACHLDKTLAWTAKRLSEWYDIAPPVLTEEHRQVADSVLWALRGDPGVRSLVGWYMGWPAARKASGDDWMIPHLALLMDDKYDAVRHIAWRSLRTFDGFASFDYDAVPRPHTRTSIVPKVFDILSRRDPAPQWQPEMLVMTSGGLMRSDVERFLQERMREPFHLLE